MINYILSYFLRLLLLYSLGMVDHWMKSFLPQPYRCSAPLYSDRPGKNDKLSLNSLLSAFLLFGVGIVISIVAFFSECLFSKISP